MHIKTKYFPFLLASSAIIVESCAAFFSVYGLTKLFSGAVIAVAIMAGSLYASLEVISGYHPMISGDCISHSYREAT